MGIAKSVLVATHRVTARGVAFFWWYATRTSARSWLERHHLLDCSVAIYRHMLFQATLELVECQLFSNVIGMRVAELQV